MKFIKSGLLAAAAAGFLLAGSAFAGDNKCNLGINNHLTTVITTDATANAPKNVMPNQSKAGTVQGKHMIVYYAEGDTSKTALCEIDFNNCEETRVLNGNCSVDRNTSTLNDKEPGIVNVVVGK